jgi:hypothetical protein
MTILDFPLSNHSKFISNCPDALKSLEEKGLSLAVKMVW